MGEVVKFKVQKESPFEEWSTIEFVEYYKRKHLEVLKFKTHKPDGMLRAHINEKSIIHLWNLGRHDAPGMTANKLYKEYMDWVFENKRSKKDGLIRVWFMNHEEMMTDFLDRRSMAIQEAELGSLDDFKKAEEERIKKAQEAFASRRKEKEEEARAKEGKK